MMKFKLLCVIYAVSTIGASGCQSERATKGARPDQIEKPPYSMQLSSPPNIIKSGSVVRVILKVINTSDHDMIAPRFREDVPQSSFIVDVRDRQGHPAPLAHTWPVPRVGVVTDLPSGGGYQHFLGAGASLQFALDISKTHRLSHAGKYTVQARQFDRGTNTWVFSNTVTVDVAHPSQEPSSPEKAETPFTLSIASPQDTIKAGSEVSLLPEVLNTSDHVIVFDPIPSKLDIWVRDSQGNLAPLTRKGQEFRKHSDETGGGALQMRPGDTAYLGEVMVDKLYDLTRPGKYTIQVSRVDDATKTWVKSNTITITVTPK